MPIKSLHRIAAAVALSASTVTLIALPAHAETDAVVDVYNNVIQYDATTEVLTQLGLTDGSWEFCRTTPMDPRSGSATVTDNHLYISAGAYKLKPGATTQETITVQPCTEDTFGDWKRVTVVIKAAKKPTAVTKKVGKKCSLTIGNPQKDVDLNVYLHTADYGQYANMYAAPGKSDKITFNRKAPKEFVGNASYYNDSQYFDAGVLISINTKTCKVKLTKGYAGDK